jgi:hypothetical protein
LFTYKGTSRAKLEATLPFLLGKVEQASQNWDISTQGLFGIVLFIIDALFFSEVGQDSVFDKVRKTAVFIPGRLFDDVPELFGNLYAYRFAHNPLYIKIIPSTTFL